MRDAKEIEIRIRIICFHFLDFEYGQLQGQKNVFKHTWSKISSSSLSYHHTYFRRTYKDYLIEIELIWEYKNMQKAIFIVY